MKRASLALCMIAALPGIGPCDAAAQEPAIPADYSVALQPWTGDYDGMLERRMIRVAVPYSLTHYFLDGATERGIDAAMGRELERQINGREGRRSRLVHVMFIPTPRTELISYVTRGLADIAMGSLAVTEARREEADFSIPFIRS